MSEEIMEQINTEIHAVLLDENNIVKNFIVVAALSDMPNCVEWQEGVVVGSLYNVEDNTFIPPEPTTEPVPQSVSRRQARQALLLAGLLDDVDAAIATMTDETQRRLAQIEWEDSQTFERNRPLLIALGTALGLSSEDLDLLFVQASKL